MQAPVQLLWNSSHGSWKQMNHLSSIACGIEPCMRASASELENSAENPSGSRWAGGGRVFQESIVARVIPAIFSTRRCLRIAQRSAAGAARRGVGRFGEGRIGRIEPRRGSGGVGIHAQGAIWSVVVVGCWLLFPGAGGRVSILWGEPV